MMTATKLVRAFRLVSEDAAAIHMFTLVGSLNEAGEFSPSRIHGYSDEERTEDKQDVKIVDCLSTDAVFRVTITTTEGATSATVHQLDRTTGLFQEIPGAVLPVFSKVARQQQWMTKRAAKWAPGMVITRSELENTSAGNETTCDKPTDEVGNTKPVSKPKEQPKNSGKPTLQVKKRIHDKPTAKVGNSESDSKPKACIPDPGKYAPRVKKNNLNREKENATTSMTGSIYLSLEDIQPELQRHGLALMFTAGKFRIVSVKELVSGV